MGHEDPIAGQKLRVCYGVVAAMRLPDRALEQIENQPIRDGRSSFPVESRKISCSQGNFRGRRDFAQAEESRAEIAEVTACLDGVLVASLHSGDGERLDRVNTISGPIFARKSNALLTDIRRCVRRHRSRSPATDQPAPHRLRVRKKASLNASTAGRFGCASQYA